MIPWDKIKELHRRSAELKVPGDYAAMLPLREEAAQLLEEHGASAKDVANEWNYVAHINLQIGDLPAAERAARRSLSYYLEHSAEKDDGELFASYVWMLCTVLEKQGRFAEALPHLEEAILVFERLHGDDDFMVGCRGELEKIREQLWRE